MLRCIDAATTDGIAEIEALVQCQLNGRVYEFGVVRVAEGLILRGHAHTYYAKQLAQHLVMQATDAPIVANEIEVS